MTEEIKKAAMDNNVKKDVISLCESLPQQIQASVFGKLCETGRENLDPGFLLGILGKTEHWVEHGT
jgi:hypothetical protein